MRELDVKEMHEIKNKVFKLFAPFPFPFRMIWHTAMNYMRQMRHQDMKMHPLEYHDFKANINELISEHSKNVTVKIEKNCIDQTATFGPKSPPQSSEEEEEAEAVSEAEAIPWGC